MRGVEMAHDERPRKELAAVRVSRKLKIETCALCVLRTLRVVREQKPHRSRRRIRDRHVWPRTGT